MTHIHYTINISTKILLAFCFYFGCECQASNPKDSENIEKFRHQDYQLIWEDNFDQNGYPNSKNWNFEYGFIRNRELQWYKPQNAYCLDGLLIIEGKKEKTNNPNYNPLSNDWRINRPKAQFTSASLITKGLNEWPPFGYFEIKARIDVAKGAWPAIWLLGTENSWPYCGEIDIMEFYRINNVPHILANAAWGSESNHSPNWDSAKIPLQHFTQNDPEWADKFHIWSMFWDKKHINIYLDDELFNEIDLQKTINPDGDNPFTSDQKFYLLLNLAIGANGGDPAMTKFPMQFEVDYVKVYKKIKP